MKAKLILIGGVPGNGKTTIAYKFALKMKIDKVLSTDMLKIFAKTYNKDFDKYIFTTTHEAYKLENLSVIEGYLKHSCSINKLVLEVLENIKDKVIIIEGSTINKEFINMLNKEKYEVFYLNLSTSINELIARYKQKEKLRQSNWRDNIKIIEEIAEYLSKDSINILNNNKEETVERIEEYVKENLYI